ncbi:MAG TPA: hypothetical protein VFZ34_09385 [Blastocatellia bacterium]|nr:hypothetical protein [Blastocatellia bacterium]
MFHNWDLTQEEFDCLLTWLHPDRDEAGQKYETIRIRVRKTIAARGCSAADDIFGEAVYRIARKLPELLLTYEGDPALYFYGVANHVYKEYKRVQVETEELNPSLPASPPEDRETAAECLDKCLNLLAPADKELVLRFYRKDRKTLAADYGLSDNALRLRLFRLRQKLGACIEKCQNEKNF